MSDTGTVTAPSGVTDPNTANKQRHRRRHAVELRLENRKLNCLTTDLWPLISDFHSHSIVLGGLVEIS